MSALLALQKAIFQALQADATLTALIGAQKLFDEPPADAKPPYLVFASIIANDWSTGTESGEEIFLDLEIWSARRGRNQAGDIAQAVRDALNPQPALDPPWRLVNFVHQSTVTARDAGTEYFRALMRFRAVVEPL